jgi:hypothetical protein
VAENLNRPVLGPPPLARNPNRGLTRSVLPVFQINTTIESQSEYGQRQSSASGSVVMKTVMGAEQLQHIILPPRILLCIFFDPDRMRERISDLYHI